MVNLDDLKAQIKNIPPDDLAAPGVIVPARTKANGNLTYICPNCGNGEGDSGDGIAFNYKGGAWLAKCFKCGAGFDNIKLLAVYFGLDSQKDFVEVCNRAAALFGIAASENDFSSYHNLKPLKNLPPKKSFEETAEEIEIKKLTLKFIRSDLAKPDNLEKLSEYNRRGLTVETLRYFHCIYDEKWRHPKILAKAACDSHLDFQKLPPRSRRLLIPSSNNHYVAVLVKSDRTNENKSRWKMHAGSKTEIFGLQTLSADTDCIFVYEGEFNAMTAWQAWQENNFLRQTMNIFEVDTAENLDSGEIVSADFVPYSAFLATGGAAESFWVEMLDAKCKELGISPRVIVNFDKDQAGEGGAAKVQKELRARGFLTAINFIEGDE